jgi:hypothetical protein
MTYGIMFRLASYTDNISTYPKTTEPLQGAYTSSQWRLSEEKKEHGTDQL